MNQESAHFEPEPKPDGETDYPKGTFPRLRRETTGSHVKVILDFDATMSRVIGPRERQQLLSVLRADAAQRLTREYIWEDFGATPGGAVAHVRNELRCDQALILDEWDRIVGDDSSHEGKDEPF